MAARAPSSVTIRMYNVGFGDCFLLTFHYPGGDRRMLIDYGTTSAPKSGSRDYMLKVAEDIREQCGGSADGNRRGKLHIVVATHRHRDHISGFSTEGEGTGNIIASLHPDHVIQPWTEDPKAKPDALAATASTFTHGKPDAKKLTAHFLGSLEDMHAVADSVANLALAGKVRGGAATINQLSFLGQDNLKNPSAVRNLMSMAKKAKAYYVNAGMKLNGLLPGVKITVLGPPTLKQSDKIRKQRSKDPSEFWQFRNFWASQSLAAAGNAARQDAAPLFPGAPGVQESDHPPNVRWFIKQARQMHTSQVLELVRDLDTVMNNTSVILLFEIGDRKLLFPGDAQIENWSFALQNDEWKQKLADVNLYKVGHHGSLNATPKSLWGLFHRKGREDAPDRLQTLCSTKKGKHGNAQAGTEVPRRVLVADLEKDSAFVTTEKYKKTIHHDVTIPIG